MGVPDSPIWPDLPHHSNELLDGPKGRELGDAMSDGAPENEVNFRIAIKNALNAQDQLIKKLCNGCCDEVTIIIEVENDGLVMSAINTINRDSGMSLTSGTNKSTYSCP